MKFSAWSSLAISACSALLLAPAAPGHVTVTPPFVAAGETATLVLTAPNERGWPMTGLTVSTSDGLRIVQVPQLFVTDRMQLVPPTGWSRTLEARTAWWSDGQLAPGEEATFAVTVEAWATPGPAAVLVTQLYPNGEEVEWPVPVTITPAPEETSRRGRALAAALLLCLAAILIVGLVWRRRASSLQER